MYILLDNALICHISINDCPISKKGWQEKAQQGLLHLLGEEGSKTMKVSESSGNDLNMLHNNFNLKRLIQMYFNKVMNNQTFSFKIESNEKISMIEESID